MITSRQFKILSLVDRTRDVEGWSPTLRELAEYVGLKSTSTIHKEVELLVTRNLLDKGPKGYPRMLRVTEHGREEMSEYSHDLP